MDNSWLLILSKALDTSNEHIFTVLPKRCSDKQQTHSINSMRAPHSFLKTKLIVDETRYMLNLCRIQCLNILDITGLIDIPVKSLTDAFFVQPFTLTNGSV